MIINVSKRIIHSRKRPLSAHPIRVVIKQEILKDLIAFLSLHIMSIANFKADIVGTNVHYLELNSKRAFSMSSINRSSPVAFASASRSTGA